MRRLAGLVFILSLVCLGNTSSGAIEFSAENFKVAFSSDGRVASFKSISDGKELVNTANPGDGFFLADISNRRIRLGNLTFNGGKLLASTADNGQQVVFNVKPEKHYISFKIESLKGIPTNSGLALKFEMNCDSKVKVFETDYMTSAYNHHNKVQVEWEYIWNRHESNPLGSFAMFFANDDDMYDDIVIRIWANENLPHPKVDGKWTYERAKQWVAKWQDMFADQSQFILEAENLKDLYKGIRYAQKADAKQIYLFTNTWRGGFWPVGCGNWDLRKDVFPNGEADLKKYSDYLLRKGIYLKLHYLSGSIAVDDPYYISNKPDDRLASWGKGTLAKPAGANDKDLYFKPDAGVELPYKVPHGMRLLPPGMGRWCGFKHVRVGDEIIQVGSFEQTHDDVWLLKNCIRGKSGAKVSAHAKGTSIVGLIDTYGQNLLPDNNSTMLEEIAKGYGEFCNRTGVYNVEFDGFENNCYNGGWGGRKFASIIYQNLDHPCTSGGSGAKAPDCWIEYRLNSTKKLMGGFRFNVHSSHRAPLFVDSPSRPATSLLETHFELSQGAMAQSCAFGMSKPEPMFGLTVNELKTHGLSDRIAENVKNWKLASQYMTSQQKEQIQKSFKPAITRFPGSSRDPRSSLVYVLDKQDDQEMLIKPTKVLARKSGDIDWHSWQEHGPIIPRQYIKLGESLELNNPFSAQPPKFVIRVLSATDYNSQENINLQPDASQLSGLGDTLASTRNGGLTLALDNKRNNPVWEAEKLAGWRQKPFDMNQHRAIAMEVTGDGSNSIIVFQIYGADYVVPIDFKGRRYIEIPNGQAAWANGLWGWRKGTHRSSYNRVGSFKIGFGHVKPKTNAEVTVEGLKALKEIETTLNDLTIKVAGGMLKIEGNVSSGQYIEYDGGDKAVVYDKDWNKLDELAVFKRNYVMQPEMSKVTVTSSNNNRVSPWLQVQFMTEDKPIVVK